MRRIIFIVLIIFLSIFSAQNYSVKAAVQDQMNIDAYVDAETSGIGVGAPFIPDNAPPVIYDVEIYEITTQSAKVSWKTNENASAYIYYGKTSSYEIGVLQDHPESIGLFHDIAIIRLEAGTKYYFQLRSLDSAGNQGIKDGYSFTTLPELIAPSNVSFFTAKSFDGKIILNWENPQDGGFAGVQINKKINSPALSFDQGEMIYSGSQENFEDKDIKNGIKYYYTAFSYDSAGNFSSGAIAFAIGVKTAAPPAEPPIVPEPPIIPPEIFPFDVENLETIPDSKNKEIEIKWDNPGNEDFEDVEIYRSKDFPAMAPGEGEIVYKGKESGFKDKNIKEDEVYYYTAFTKDKSGNYSAGKTITGTLKKLPISSMESISMDDISFIFSEEALLLPRRGDRKIYAFPKKEINVYYDSKNLPETLKTIIVTIGRSPYILSLDNDNKFYRAKFISPGAAGNYPMTISVLDFKHGKIFQAKAEMVVEDYGKVFELKIKDYESKSFFEKKALDIGYWILDIFNKKEFLNLNEINIEEAIITLYEFDEENNKWRMWDAEKYNQKNPQLTNQNGEFGFIVPNGRYKIVIEKENYISQSEIVEVENNIINSEIEIKKEVDWRVLPIVLAVLVLIYAVWRRKRQKRKRMLDLK